MITPNPAVAAMEPYALASLSGSAAVPLISLSQNESLRPPAPGVMTAIAQAATGAALYPDPDWRDLRAALAELHGLRPADILCGAGSLDLIGCLMRAYVGSGRAVLAPEHAYPFFRTAAQIVGARFDTAPEVDGTVDVDALLAAIQPDTVILCLANPGNPTGTRLPRSEILRLRQGMPDNVLLVLDEAYGEFADHLDAPMFDLTRRDDTVVLRTFSKAYGLAGCRVGWGVFPPGIAAELRKVMNPNNIPLTSQAAARAAVHDQDYMRKTCAITAELRDMAARRLAAAGFSVWPSETNFLSICLPSDHAAIRADDTLRHGNIILRRQSGANLPHVLRLTIGPATALNAALSCLETWKEETLP